MPRWPMDTRERLIAAAFELFSEHGFFETTVADIARRADSTSRTFFRHFPDKDEVLFAGDDDYLPLLTASIVRFEGSVDAGTMMRSVLGDLADQMQGSQEHLRARQSIIERNVSLQGRELAKQALWQRAVSDALRTRGFDRSDAELLAAIGFALFTSVLNEWLATDGGRSLRDAVFDRFPRIGAVLGEPVPSPPDDLVRPRA